MPRNLIICCDGTDNEFGSRNTNVVRLIQVLAQGGPVQQLVYYDPGIGTMPEPDRSKRFTSAIDGAMDAMFATRLDDRLARAYTWLANSWEPGDQVYLFGFSRGAYTVRVVAGMLYLLGLCHPHSENLIPYAVRLFGSLRDEGDSESGEDESEGDATYWEVSDEFRETFARPAPGGVDRSFPVHFVGVWDTVSSVGWVWDPQSCPFTAKNPGVRTVRHAIALDERRAFFRPNHFTAAGGQDCVEHWFAGVHSDIGGGYAPSDGGSWKASFEWMVGEAREAGLGIDDVKLGAVLQANVQVEGMPPARPVWEEPLHESLRGWWWVCEVFPKLVYDPTTGRRWPRLGLGRRRVVPPGAILDVSLMERIHGTGYAPANLSAGFVAGVKGVGVSGDGVYQT